MSPAGRPEWPPLRVVGWTLFALLVLVVMGQRFVSAFRPPGPEQVLDFAQEWLSAKNFRAGLPVYGDQAEALRHHTGVELPRPDRMNRYNAHPPASVLLALPFGRLDYADAMLAWNLLTFPLLLAAIALVVRELDMPFRPLSLIPAVALIVGAYPVVFQVDQGQINALLVFLLTAAWAADRRDRQALAGVLVGAAAALKLVPLFLLVYFVAARRWRAAVALVATFAALTGVALAVLGIDQVRAYLTEVLPAVHRRWHTGWRNSSIEGFWMRLFGPQPEAGVIPAADAPARGMRIANALRAAVVAACGWAAWRARSVGGRDRAFAAALVGMVLVSPITWGHYFVLLLLPLGLVWMRTPGFLPRVLMWAVFVVLWLPDTVPVSVFVGAEQGKLIGSDDHRPLTPAEVLRSVSLPHYALVGLFLLTLFAPARPGDDEPGGAAADDERLNRRLFGDPPGP
jgi:hypothetical protein